MRGAVRRVDIYIETGAAIPAARDSIRTANRRLLQSANVGRGTRPGIPARIADSNLRLRAIIVTQEELDSVKQALAKKEQKVLDLEHKLGRQDAEVQLSS